MELKAAEAAAALHFETLDTTITDRREYDLAMRHAPVILFDVREPFLPSVIGYTVFRQDGRSLSFPRDITLPPGAVCAIEGRSANCPGSISSERIAPTASSTGLLMSANFTRSV